MNHAILSDAIAVMKKTLRAAQDKIYFVTNRRYLILGVILSVETLAGILAAETFNRRIFLGVYFLLARYMEPFRCHPGAPDPSPVEGNTGRREHEAKTGKTSTLQHFICARFCRRGGRRSVCARLEHLGFRALDPGRISRRQSPAFTRCSRRPPAPDATFWIKFKVSACSCEPLMEVA